MKYTAEDIINLSRNSQDSKYWNGDDPREGFSRGIFNTHNWNDRAIGLIRQICYDIEDINDESAHKSQLHADLNHASCWVEYSTIYTTWIYDIGDYYAIKFWYEDENIVFFQTKDNSISYLVQWYKHRGRTEWILIMDGTDMSTSRLVNAQEYANLLNGIKNKKYWGVSNKTFTFEYNFDIIDTLEQEEYDNESGGI